MAHNVRESSDLYKLVVDALPELVWVERADNGERIYSNEAFGLYFGTDSAVDVLERCHPHDRDRIRYLFDVNRAKGGSDEARLRCADGRDVWHKLTVKALVSGGELVGWLNSALDVEQMVKDRRALKETGDLLRLSQEAAGAGLFDVRFTSREVILSPVSARLHGLSGDRPAVISVGDWMRRVHPADRAPTLRAVRHAIAHSWTFDLEFRVLLTGGEVRWIQAIGRLCKDEASKAHRITGLNLDISARKEAETALIEAKGEAETARLAAERANSAKTEFLSAMSHELRTPLNAVIGFAGLLAGSARLDGELQRYAELVHTSGAHLLGIVNDILDFSSVEAGAVTLNRQPFAVKRLVDGCLAIVGATGKALDMASSIDAGMPEFLVGDEARLQQVLLNLLNNAVKFTQSGSVTLSVRHEGRTPRGERILFSVTDTGIGIAPDKQRRLFERFYQVDSSIRRDYGGTGLGLAISKRLVERMGGEIGVTSSAGCGSTFWFTLTLPRAETAVEPAAPKAGMPATRPAKILLVEDIDINRELASVMLQAAGHSVDLVENGFDAVRAVQMGRHDLVLMDIQMPGMDGLMATRLIRCLPGDRARVPIVAMTANVLPPQVEAFREAGLDDHLGKPFSTSELEATIARWHPRPAAAPETEPVVATMVEPAFTIDRACYEDSLGMLPPHSAARLLAHLGRIAKDGFSGPSETRDDRDRLRRAAHALTSASGLIGFSSLSASCAALDGYGESRIAEAGLAGFDMVLANTRALADAAASETQRLIAAMQETPSPAVRAGP